MICSRCGQDNSMFLRPESSYQWIDSERYCSYCAQIILKEKAELIKATSTNNIDGFFVEDYIDIESIEVVVGTGVFSEWNSEISDFFGTRSTGFELKLQKAKKAALTHLKTLAYQKGGDAVIGVDIDYTEFSGNRIGIVINGTIVKLSPIISHQLNQIDTINKLTPEITKECINEDVSVIDNTEVQSAIRQEDYVLQQVKNREEKLTYWKNNPEELIQLQTESNKLKNEIMATQNEKISMPERSEVKKLEKEVFVLSEEANRISFIKKSEKEILNKQINSKLSEVTRFNSIIHFKETSLNKKINEIQRRINEIDNEIKPR